MTMVGSTDLISTSGTAVCAVTHFTATTIAAGKMKETLKHLIARPINLLSRILHCLCDENSIRATARLTDVAINTVVKLLCEAGKACLGYQDKVSQFEIPPSPTGRSACCQRLSRVRGNGNNGITTELTARVADSCVSIIERTGSAPTSGSGRAIPRARTLPHRSNQ